MDKYSASLQDLLSPQFRGTCFRARQDDYTPTQLGVEFARLAYYSFKDSDIARLRRDVGLVGYSGLRAFSTALGTQAFVARHGDGPAIVAFRGTQPESILDIGVDVTAGLETWRGPGRVHEGFRAAFETVRTEIEGWMATEGIEPAQVLLCGHSLGGALATLAAACWTDASLVTIGSPRIGDADFAASVSGARCQRIFNCCDLVARVPPRELGYEHVEPSWFITSKGEAIPNPGAPRIDAERHIARGDYFAKYFGLGNAPVRDLADHAPVNYRRTYFP